MAQVTEHRTVKMLANRIANPPNDQTIAGSEAWLNGFFHCLEHHRRAPLHTTSTQSGK
jgi:hypothetical protein